MIIYGLYGPSGTGKSTSSLFFAHEQNIPAIIDDGLLIYKGKRVAGASAKFEKNYITAVKRATFHMEHHRNEVVKALKQYKIKKLLIIGTSIRMVDKIANALQLGQIDHYVNVTDLRSSSEIKMALYVRKTEGKHVIPVPYLQIEQNFFKKMITKGKRLFSHQREYIGETTIVHPDFTRGTIHISDNILNAIVEKEVSRIKDIKACKHVTVHMYMTPTIQVHVSLHYPLSRPLKEVGTDIQKRIIDAFQQFLELEIEQVKVTFEK
ncbi:hypothetical protein [Pueribacillus sp. YX66]|uniref:hypothetical protein n=1 Tax=Pueribacillus sp. YX66 TaxID=3229242 RepID=UPI00358DA018